MGGTTSIFSKRFRQSRTLRLLLACALLLNPFFGLLGPAAQPANAADGDLDPSFGSGGKVVSARRPIYGADKVARFLFGIFKEITPDFPFEAVIANGYPAFSVYNAGKPYTVVAFELDKDKINAIYSIRNPDKLRHLEK